MFPNKDDMLEINGNYGEGGGAILRNALSLSALLNQDIKIINIRKDRKNSGMAAQHLSCVFAAAKICNGEYDGAEIGSEELVFKPGEICGGEYFFNIGTAGSITLLLQSILPMLAFAKKESKITVKGGTHVNWSPSFDYLNNVLFPCLKRMGYVCNAKLKEYGWYPKGGGEVFITTKPVENIKNINLDGGKLIKIEGISCASNLPENVVERQINSAKKILTKNGLNAFIMSTNKPSFSTGSCLTLWAEFENGFVGASDLGKLGKKAEEVGENAAKKLIKYMCAPVDPYLTDQLILYFVLAEGNSTLITSEITEHTKTNIWLSRLFLPNIKLKVDKKLEITGIGLHRQF